ncbi:MAG: hypothetical protein KatS3mg114_0141 [Planctomycetaceae bacterium]|nr:MAG: hypothetical protein KatS3mg114_0141 [Planctomycetaceae bacterium]
MVPLIVLIAVTLVARLVGQFGVLRLREWAAATRLGLAAMFCFTAAAHFNSMRADLVRMVPAGDSQSLIHGYIHRCLRNLRCHRPTCAPHTSLCCGRAGFFLLAVLPANIHAAQSGVTLRGDPVTPVIPRVALQVLFITLVWRSGVRSPRERGAPATTGGSAGRNIA